MDIQENIKNIPLSSGVYFMKDAQGKILYIGKAVCLRKRVQSYFRPCPGAVTKTDRLVSKIKQVDYLLTASEAEALILEASLVKQFRPKYNIDLKDDKSYPYIQITDEPYPRVRIVRPRSQGDQLGAGTLFGPYVNSKLIREALLIIRKVFHFRTCSRLPEKECLDFHLKLCDGPCVKAMSLKDYHRVIRHVTLILEGRKDDLYRDLRRQMEQLAGQKEFEKAAVVRDQIQAIGALYSGTKDINYFKEAEQLQRALGLARVPQRIEAFDISNTMGQQAVGSMVSFLSGKPDKSQYRRFRIKTVAGIDDVDMIGEVVHRRYARLKKEGLFFPDLILIDGGKGQLSRAYEELQKLGLDIPVASLAKKKEEIFLPQKRLPIVLGEHSLGLKLVQRVRDEAHRFALRYHRLLRGKKFLDDK